MQILALDIGGVFYRGWPDAAFWPRWSERTGLTAEALEDFLIRCPEAKEARIGRISADEYYQQAGGRLAVPPETLRALAEAAFTSDFDTAFAEFVRGLRARGVRVSALTNSLSRESEIKTRPALRGLFDHVVSSCEVGAGKPDPAIFQAFLDRHGAEAGAVTFVDDLLPHVEAARALGFSAIHCQRTEAVIAELSALYAEAAFSSRR